MRGAGACERAAKERHRRDSKFLQAIELRIGGPYPGVLHIVVQRKELHNIGVRK
jgi:hypothetical protein